MDAETTLIRHSSIFKDIITSTEAGLSAAVYEQVYRFYEIAHTELYADGVTRPEYAEKHLRVAQEIGELMDMQFLKHLEQRDDFGMIDRIVDILPLRGALGLVSEENILSRLNSPQHSEAYSILPIGIKRDGPEAAIYFPSELVLESRLSQVANRTVYRIKDFGIATGGTSVELVQTISRLIEGGVEPGQIVIQGAAGTLMAQERIKREFPNVNVLFAVEGEMPIEREAKELLNKPDNTLDFLSLIALVENKIKRENGTIDSSMYYLDRIKPVGESPFHSTLPFEGGEISPSDWGDESFTAMGNEDYVYNFLAILTKVLSDNGQELSDQAAKSLYHHYFGTLVKNKA